MSRAGSVGKETRTVHCSTCGVMMRQSSIYPNDDPHERKTDIADISLVKEAIFHAMDSITNEKVPRNILLVSNDKDFKCTLEALKLRGFTVMAAIEAKTPNHMYADICGNGTWCWKEMEKGAASDQSRLPYFLPSASPGA
ncbi:predicted protein [Arabidopsis lyrata subsp. lyrata]|uniref:Predicted protein n=1 Tax=Arabidopsis lyrata subsp. lyrata TaxID=81972 RepID=D7LJA8_ARALL|nr:predicted protein [Arabidopsis lyrata subsp. lyrata]